MKTRKLKFVKESDLFDWKVDEEIEIVTDKKNRLCKFSTKILQRGMTIFPERTHSGRALIAVAQEIVKAGYAVWLDDEEEKPLVEQVDALVGNYAGDIILQSKRFPHTFNKYECIKIYDHIVKELNGDWVPDWNNLEQERFYIMQYNNPRHMNHKSLKTVYAQGQFTEYPAKSEEICQAILDSKKMRPYLNKIYPSCTKSQE